MEKLDKLKYDTIVLGGTLEALIHSYVEGIPLIMVNPQIPFSIDLDPLGSNKSKVWAKLSFFLSYAGLNPLGLKAESYRLEENNIVSVFGKSSYKVEFEYNNIIRYDQIKPTEMLRVFDYLKIINVRKNHKNIIKQINSGDDFVNHFLTDFEKDRNYICAVSKIKRSEIDKEGYSEIYARLKSVELIKSAGVTGTIDIDKNSKVINRFIKITSLKREVIYDTIEEENQLLAERKPTKHPALQKITQMLGSPYVA
jgi:hypothetical protein